MAHSAELQSDIVSKNAVDFTPVLVTTTAVPKPHIDAMGRVGATIFAGGLFESVSHGNTAVAKSHFVAFDATTGQLKSVIDPSYVDPVFDGQIWAIATDGESVYVGGQFSSVNGLARGRLVKINAATGAVDLTFNPKFNTGILWDLKLWSRPEGPMLVVAGNFKGRLIGVNPTTGADTGFFALGLADPLPGAWGGIAVYRIAINPAGTRLVATGNFQTVAGQSRTRFFMADIAGASAVLDPWYYPGFAKRCSATHARRIAYLQGVDFSPDGSYFIITATGQIPYAKADIWPAGTAQYHTVCDAVGRFNVNDDQHPAWINYTGGDSIWVAAATGPAVYVQGHFQWLDNPNGFASRDGGGAVRREGIGAIDPETGSALPWNPLKPTQIGGKTLLVTPDGLWIGSDSVKFDGIARRGLAFTPLPLTMIGAGDIATCGSTDDELTAAIVSATEAIPFTVGDNAYDAGTATQFTDCYGPSWGAFASQTRPAPGERDYLTTNAAAYFGYFGAAAGEPTQGYYSYNVGAWHVVVLNSMCERVGGCGATAPMVTWLKADLAANPTKCTLAYFHHPLFSSGLTAGNTKMRPVWNALYAAKADVVVNAHDSHYERFARQQADGVPNEVRGIRQFVVGTGGAPLAGFGTVQPNSEVRNADSFGVLKLRLHPSSYEWSFVPAEGSTFTDSGTTDCY